MTTHSIIVQDASVGETIAPYIIDDVVVYSHVSGDVYNLHDSDTGEVITEVELMDVEEEEESIVV